MEVEEFLEVSGELNLGAYRRGRRVGRDHSERADCERGCGGRFDGVGGWRGTDAFVGWAVGDDGGFGLMDRVVEAAAARECTRVRGEFVAKGRNEAMREYLAQFGFTMIGEDEGSTLWILPVSAYEPTE